MGQSWTPPFCGDGAWGSNEAAPDGQSAAGDSAASQTLLGPEGHTNS